MTNSSTEKDHVNEVVIKLIGANVIVYNVREYVLSKTLKPVYHAVFNSDLNYAWNNLVWCHNINKIWHLTILQKNIMISKLQI